MKPVRIKVECRSGYKANEYPIRFYWNQRCYDIGEIRDRWYRKTDCPDLQLQITIRFLHAKTTNLF